MPRLAVAELRETTRRVLFIDDDNHCGSRFCETQFNHLAATARAPWLAFSRSSSRQPAWHTAGPMCPVAIDELERRGIGARNALRLPLECTNFDLLVADVVIGLDEARDRPLLEARWPKSGATVRYWAVGSERRSRVAALTRLERLVRETFVELTERSAPFTVRRAAFALPGEAAPAPR